MSKAPLQRWGATGYPNGEAAAAVRRHRRDVRDAAPLLKYLGYAPIETAWAKRLDLLMAADASAAGAQTP